MQKIAFHLNSLQQGGAERVVSNLANRFAKEGYEVVIATEWYGTDEFALDQKVRRVHVGLTKEDENRSIAGIRRGLGPIHRLRVPGTGGGGHRGVRAARQGLCIIGRSGGAAEEDPGIIICGDLESLSGG